MSLIRVLPLVLCLAAPAAAQEAFTWHYDALYPIDPAETALNLVATQEGFTADTPAARLPGGLIWARCVPGGADGNVALRFEAFPVAALAFDEYAFQMNDGGGTVLTLQAPLVARELDQPTGGLEVFVAHDGPELAMLASAPVVTYGIVGFTDFQLPFDLSGNQDYVTRFVEDCGALSVPAASSAPGDIAQGGAVAPPAELQPELGPDITGHVRARFTQVDAANPSATIISVLYGVPESDDIVISGECVVGQGEPFVQLRVGADISGLQDGDPAQLRVSIPDGRTTILDGTAVGVNAEFGVSGIEYLADVSDPAWLVIAGDRIVRFDRPDTGNGLTIEGNGPNSIGPFLADCAEAAQLDAMAGGQPSPPIDAQPGYLACENFGRVSSRDTGVAQVVNFINSSDGFRGLVWIDPTGAVVDVTGLTRGQAAAYTTDPGHIWMATDGRGNCMEMMQVPAGVTDYRITVLAQ